jgi:hypothetical protein
MKAPSFTSFYATLKQTTGVVKTFNDLAYTLGMRGVIIIFVVFAGDVVMVTSNRPTPSLIEPMVRGTLCKEWVKR